MHDIDKELQYCPKCKEEYRAEITICASCKKELISGAALLAQTSGSQVETDALPAIAESDEMVMLRKGSLQDMKNLKRLLEKSTIPCLLSKDNSCGSGCCGPEILLHIRVQDIAEAQKVLFVEHERSTGLTGYNLDSVDAVFNPEAAMVICPGCGHEFVPDGSSCPDCALQFL